jgi:hypothetical protein
MNNVAYPALRLLTIVALAALAPKLAVASDVKADASFEIAMGPQSAAQKNQDATARSDDAMTKSQHRTTHRHKHHT